MIMLLAITAIGATLGLCFKAFSLVPAIAIGSPVLCNMGVAHGNDFWNILLTLTFAVIALQVGYVVGAFVRFGTARIWARKYPPTTVAFPR